MANKAKAAGKQEKRIESPLKSDKPLSWHRGGWAERPARNTHARAERSSSPNPPHNTCVSAPHMIAQPVTYKGPIALNTEHYTYAHSNSLQHTHRTTFVRSYCPGLHGAPRADPNPAFLNELDTRLQNSTQTLLALRDKSLMQQHISQRQAGQHAAALTHGSLGELSQEAANQLDTVYLRRLVNSSLDSQLCFFTRCMARSCIRTPDCTCESCACICRQAHHSLRQAAYGRL